MEKKSLTEFFREVEEENFLRKKKSKIGFDVYIYNVCLYLKS